MIRKDKQAILKQIPILQRLPDYINQIIINKSKIVSYGKNRTVYNQDDICTSMDIIISGSLNAYSLTENGSSTVMFKFEKNNIIGGNLLLGEDNKYPLNMYCLSDCELLHINITLMKELLHYYEFTMEFIKCISQNSQGLNKKIAMYSQKTLKENILFYLKQQSIIQKTKVIILPLSKKELADYFGVQRQSLFRELKNICNQGLIEIDNKIITIKKDI